MQKDLDKARSLLAAGSYTCVLAREDTVYTSTDRGVKPLLAWINGGMHFAGFSAADKVVGKATAFLYCLLDVKEVYAPVISKAAVQVLQRSGIAVSYAEEVDFIWNRRQTAPCPMETAVRDIDDPQKALTAIRETLKTL